MPSVQGGIDASGALASQERVLDWRHPERQQTGLPMPLTVKDMIAAANAAVPRVTPAEAMAMIAREGAVVVDVRDAPEVAQSGRVAGAHHISRGMLEFRADDSTPFHDPALRKDRPVILYCASGGRSALAGKALIDMGFARVFNLGGFKDWVEAGGAVDRPLSSGH